MILYVGFDLFVVYFVVQLCFVIVFQFGFVDVGQCGVVFVQYFQIFVVYVVDVVDDVCEQVIVGIVLGQVWFQFYFWELLVVYCEVCYFFVGDMQFQCYWQEVVVCFV